jgi:predicted phosphatase
MREIVLDIDRALVDHDYIAESTGRPANNVQVVRLIPGQFNNIKGPCEIVFLQDRQSGHYIEVNDVPIVDWKRGQGIVLDHEDVVKNVTAGFVSWYILRIQ